MRDRAVVLDAALDRLDMDATVARCQELIEGRARARHLSVNVAKLVALRSDDRLRRIIADSELATPDGMPVVWASRILGDPLPMRVAGIDLMTRLLELAEERKYRVYILGGRAEVLAAAIDNIRAAYPRLIFAGSRDGYFDDAESRDVAAAIRSTEPDILLVAMSSPRKEYWIDSYGAAAGAALTVGVGGSIDIWAGKASRAPRWMQNTGLEWLFRLLQEPRRLWRRYLTMNGAFIILLAGELWRRSLRRVLVGNARTAAKR